MILTDDRLKAMAMTNRWNGWLKRPYSVLEHTVIGAYAMDDKGMELMSVLGFLLHDMHESYIVGDVPRPDKEKYMTFAYHQDVRAFDHRLREEVGADEFWRDDLVKAVDYDMLVWEHWNIATIDDPTVPSLLGHRWTIQPGNYCQPTKEPAMSGSIVAFKLLFNKCVTALELKHPRLS